MNRGNMSDTSLDAYFNPDNQAIYENDEYRVLYYVFRNRNKTQVDAEKFMKKHRHTYSGRYTKLVERGWIAKGDKVDVEGHKTKMYTYHITFLGREELAKVLACTDKVDILK